MISCGVSVMAVAVRRPPAAVGGTVAITGTPAVAKVASPFTFTPAASGGTSPYGFTQQSGTLPAGLSFNPITGAVTGTPTGV